MNRTVTVASCLLITAIAWAEAGQVVAAEPPQVELLWPAGAPDAKGTAEGDRPGLNVWLAPADIANGTAVVICPGGGYGGLMMSYEGDDVAQWFNSLGVSAFTLKYRHRGSGAGYSHPTPLADAQRAIRLVRSHAGDWKIDPTKIGILGFSAGGHLASSAGTHFDRGQADAADPIDRLSCRPDFMILAYPVISMKPPYTHGGSRQNLLGATPDPQLVDLMSNEEQVTAETPPAFIVQTDEDSVVPAENSVLFYLALRRAKVPAEIHVYEKGRHGLGMGGGDPAFKSWPDRCSDWMRLHGWVK